MTADSTSWPASTPCILTFEPILKEKVWGGDRLRAYGKQVDAGAHVGESWEIADLDVTSASGGGGGEAHSFIARGPLKGKTVRDAIRTSGDSLVRASSDGAFPLLIKFLDAAENLSVQVHPNARYAAAHPDAHLKTESWVVLEALDGASLFLGLRDGVTIEDLRAGIAGGEVESLMQRVPARVGDCHHLPSGCVHALGAGALVAEIQTPSDTTFRVFDWGRTDRELHVEQALQCASTGPNPPPTRWDKQGIGRLVESERYFIDQAKCAPGESIQIFDGASDARIVIVLDGSGRLEATIGQLEDGVELTKGMTALLPACAQSRRLCASADAPLNALLVTPRL